MAEPLLTDAERKALDLTNELAALVSREVIAPGRNRDTDWAEFAHRLHGIQRTIMAQAAARAYPDDYRLLGLTIGEGGGG